MSIIIWKFAALLLIVAHLPTILALSLREVPRREAILAGVSAASTLLLPTLLPAHAAEGLASKLRKRDPSLLKNSVFNVPPSVQVYPEFMRGSWKVTSKFRGYLFPSTKIDKARLTQDFDIPGFQKCSIAATSDVGKEQVTYELSINDKGIEDRASTLTSAIDAFLGTPSVASVIYDAPRNPNRISIDFIDYKTRNAERIELFCNARESELYEAGEDGNRQQIFVCSEYIRQVTFSGSADVGVARQVVGNYAHFWTWRKSLDESDTMTGNLLTAAYLDPQDSLFFEEPSKPVAIYSHDLSATRLS